MCQGKATYRGEMKTHGDNKLMNYTDLIRTLKSRNYYGSNTWKFYQIISHRKLTGEYLKFKVMWDTTEETWGTMKNIKQCHNLTISEYTRYSGLLKRPKWEWSICFTNNPKKFISTSNIFLPRLRDTPQIKVWSQVAKKCQGIQNFRSRQWQNPLVWRNIFSDEQTTE